MKVNNQPRWRLGVNNKKFHFKGVLFPCNHAIWSKWAPSMERTTLVTIAVTGIPFLSSWSVTRLSKQIFRILGLTGNLVLKI